MSNSITTFNLVAASSPSIRVIRLFDTGEVIWAKATLLGAQLAEGGSGWAARRLLCRPPYRLSTNVKH